MTFTPTGLTLPNCQCFTGKSQFAYMQAIDKSSSLVCLEIGVTGAEMFICKEAQDYFVSCYIGDILMSVLKWNNKVGVIEGQHKEFEAAYDRIKPLVMQRLDYTAQRLLEAK